MVGRRRVRIGFAAVVVISMVAVGHGLATGPSVTSIDRHLAAPDGAGAVVAPPANGVTVIATDSNVWRGGRSDDSRASSELFALAADGSLLYADATHDRYWDVDPVEGAEMTVEYAYSDHLTGDDCPDEWDHRKNAVDRATWETYAAAQDPDACTRNGVERVNLRSGEVTPIWSHRTPGKAATRYHDVDRLDRDRLVVADIFLDRVFVVNVTADEIEWTWNASEAYSTETAGPFPGDWTHLNDVEVLDDGRIMVSLRNLDQVVFLDEAGMIEDWTLGEEDAHGTLYEQHNPDYLPPPAGGPAVVVADSENNRLVEYQRVGGEWTRTWLWRDERLQWPRDADRLPNGHTLVTDSHGDRVIEIDESGQVVWGIDVAFPYEAERLDTGDESTGGASAEEVGLRTRDGKMNPVVGLKQLLPGKYTNAALYTTPVWMGLVELVAVVVAILTGLVWLGLEVSWARTRWRAST